MKNTISVLALLMACIVPAYASNIGYQRDMQTVLTEINQPEHPALHHYRPHEPRNSAHHVKCAARYSVDGVAAYKVSNKWCHMPYRAGHRYNHPHHVWSVAWWY